MNNDNNGNDKSNDKKKKGFDVPNFGDKPKYDNQPFFGSDDKDFDFSNQHYSGDPIMPVTSIDSVPSIGCDDKDLCAVDYHPDSIKVDAEVDLGAIEQKVDLNVKPFKSDFSAQESSSNSFAHTEAPLPPREDFGTLNHSEAHIQDGHRVDPPSASGESLKGSDVAFNPHEVEAPKASGFDIKAPETAFHNKPFEDVKFEPPKTAPPSSGFSPNNNNNNNSSSSSNNSAEKKNNGKDITSPEFNRLINDIVQNPNDAERTQKNVESIMDMVQNHVKNTADNIKNNMSSPSSSTGKTSTTNTSKTTSQGNSAEDVFQKISDEYFNINPTFDDDIAEKKWNEIGKKNFTQTNTVINDGKVTDSYRYGQSNEFEDDGWDDEDWEDENPTQKGSHQNYNANRHIPPNRQWGTPPPHAKKGFNAGWIMVILSLFFIVGESGIISAIIAFVGILISSQSKGSAASKFFSILFCIILIIVSIIFLFNTYSYSSLTFEDLYPS